MSPIQLYSHELSGPKPTENARESIMNNEGGSKICREAAERASECSRPRDEEPRQITPIHPSGQGGHFQQSKSTPSPFILGLQ